MSGRSARHTSRKVRDKEVEAEDPGDVDGIEWDDVTDVVCAARGGLNVAIALAAQQAGLEVLLAEAPDDVLAFADPETADYVRALTADFDPWPEAESGVPERVLDDPAPPGPPRRRLDTFFGAALRDWGMSCVASPYGLLYTCVKDPVLTRRHGAVEVAVLGSVDVDSVRPAAGIETWLATFDDEREGEIPTTGPVRNLVFHNGFVRGAAVDSARGTRLVRARHGVMLSVGAPVVAEAGESSPGDAAEVALVWRSASRFARLEILRPG